MEKTEALERLLKKEVKEAAREFYRNCMDYFKLNANEDIHQQFIEEFREIFRALMHGERKQEVCFLQVSLMRAKALSGEPFYRLEAYGPDFYLGEPLATRELQLNWMYREYGRFCEAVDKGSKRYIRCFQEPEISRIKLAELYTAQRIVRYLYQDALIELVHTEEFKALKVREGFQLQMGEYRGPYERLYEVNDCTKRLGEIWYGLLSNNGAN